MTGEPAIFRNPSIALAVAGSLLAAVVVLAVVVGADHRLGIDDTWWRWMRDGRSSVLVDASKGLDGFGDFLVQLVLRLAVATVLVVRSWWRRLAAWAFLAILSSPVNDLVKSLLDRARPAKGLVHAGGSSFPSGHALAAAVTAVGIVLVFVLPGRARIVGYLLAGAYVLLMAASRTVLGVHWLTDVVAGGALGAALTVGSFAVADLVARDRTDDPTPGPAPGPAPDPVAPVEPR